MAKKKASKKVSKGNPPKKTTSKKPTKAKLLASWEQVPGTFTYKCTEPETNILFICHAKKALTEEQLKMNVAIQFMLNQRPIKPGTTCEFDGFSDPAKVITELLSNPMVALQAFATQHAPGLTVTGGGASPFSVPGPFSQPKTPPAGACKQCLGVGWVCEDHPNLPQGDMCKNGGCPCCAPGAPCPACNPMAQIVLGPGDFAIGHPPCPRCQDERWISPKKACPDCNAKGLLKKGNLKVIRSGLN